MFKKNTVADGELQVKKSGETGELPAIISLLVLLKALAEETGILPQTYQNVAKTNIRVQFVGSCIDMEDFLDSYGGLIGRISEEYPVVINGLVDQMEEGTLTVDTRGERYSFTQQTSSGRGFNTLSHIYFKVSFAHEDICDFANMAVKNFRLGQNFVAVSRNWDNCDFAQNIFESSDVLYFRYLAVGIQQGDVYEEMSELLSVEQVAELWVRFLQGGASWAEFETVQDLMANGSYDGLYKWELALKLAVETIGITIGFVGNSVTAVKQNGERLNIGYNNSTGAEKLFAKIIFPA